MNPDCWGILGIDDSASERDIKRAYAKLLKTTRPEDDAEGFQQLHGAYKTALALTQSRSYEPPAEPVEPVETVNITLQDGQSIQFDGAFDPTETFQPDVPEVRLSEEQLAKIDALMKDVDELLKFPGTAQILQRWRFLTETSELLDDEFRVHLGRRVMESIIRYNQTPQPKARSWAPIGPAIVTMLDDSFFWSSSPFEFLDPLSYEDVFEFLNSVDPGLRQVTTRPVGGRIIEQKSKLKDADPRYRPDPPSEGLSGWQIFVLIWLGLGLLRACANTG